MEIPRNPSAKSFVIMKKKRTRETGGVLLSRNENANAPNGMHQE
jgi:hypothetical protein